MTTAKRHPKIRKPAKRQRKKLSPIIRKLISILQHNPHMTLDEAGRQAGYKGRHVAQAASNALRRTRARNILIDAMDHNKNLNNSALLAKLVEGLNAMESKIATIGGKITDTKNFKDYATRKTYLELAGRWKQLEKVVAEPEDKVMVQLTDAQLALIAQGKNTPGDFIHD